MVKVISRNTTILSVVVILSSAFLLVGCTQSGPQVTQVVGTVTYQGKPLPLGSIQFIPKEKHGKSKGAQIDANGRYQTELAPGQYLIAVRMIARLRGQPELDGEGTQVKLPEVEWLLPEKFAHNETSGVEIVVEPDTKNQIDIKLK